MISKRELHSTGFQPSAQILVSCCLLVICMACGCAPSTTSEDDASKELSVTIGGELICITDTSTPTQVAEAALKIAAAGDHQTFAQLIADQTVSSDFQSITGGREKFKQFANESSNLAAGVIFRKLSSLDADSCRVVDETITGDRATVKIAGQTQGKDREEMLFFQHESGLWKLVPSHR
mgnify:CR=1 FL=1